MKDEMRQRHRISDSDSQATTCCLDLNWKEKKYFLPEQLSITFLTWRLGKMLCKL